MTRSPDPTVEQLQALVAYMDIICDQLRKQNEQLQRLARGVNSLITLVDGFTGNGSCFRSYQLDPMVVAYAAILGPILGDRIDGAIEDKGEAYIEEMLKGAAVMARQLLRTLDAYQSERGSLDYLESVAGDIRDPGEPPSTPPSPS